jgi:hypothetical protein
MSDGKCIIFVQSVQDKIVPQKGKRRIRAIVSAEKAGLSSVASCKNLAALSAPLFVFPENNMKYSVWFQRVIIQTVETLYFYSVVQQLFENHRPIGKRM